MQPWPIFVLTSKKKLRCVVSTGPRSTDGGEPGDQPWANQSSVHALLNSDMPVPKTKQAGEEEDPLLLMRKPKKQKKVTSSGIACSIFFGLSTCCPAARIIIKICSVSLIFLQRSSTVCCQASASAL